MTTFTRNLRLTVEADGPHEADHKVHWIVDAIADSDVLPTDVVATAPHIEPEWLDDAGDMAQADHIEVAWVARDERGRIVFQSDTTISSEQAVGMFRGIGEAS